jgi:hypothetical protein
MKKIVLTLMVLTMLPGCAVFRQDYGLDGGRNSFWDPSSLFMSNMPQGDDDYSQGFRDGCNTAMGNTGSGYLRSHGFAYDVHRGLEDADYYRGYKIGNNYCTYYVNFSPL